MNEFLDTLTTEELIILFESVRDKLNLKSITQYSKDNNIAYNTAKKHIPFVTIAGTKYLPDVE